MDISKIPTRENLVDVVVMLSMRPAEVGSLQINHYEVDPSNPPAWYEDGVNVGDVKQFKFATGKQ